MQRLRLDQPAIDALKVFGLIIDEDDERAINYATGNDIAIQVWRSDHDFYEFLLELQLPNGSTLGVPLPREVLMVNATRETKIARRG